MVVLLDNIIQTYGTSWEVIDADKVIAFTPQRNSGDPMPDGEILSTVNLMKQMEFWLWIKLQLLKLTLFL